jgi:hypothetical protein
MTSADFAQPFGNKEERSEEHAILKALASHLANLESIAAEPRTTWSAEEMEGLPPVPGEQGASPAERLTAWAGHHAGDLEEVQRLAASPTLDDAELRRGLALAEAALAALLGITAEEMAVRIRSDAGKGLRTPTSRDLPTMTPEPEEDDRESGLPVIVRPRPDTLFRRVREKGADKSWLEQRIDPSDSWWEKGGLVVDEQGPALIDADGVRHPFPEAARGGNLVRATVTLAAGGGGGRPLDALLLFVTSSSAGGQRVVLRLPREGFGEAEVEETELEAFARRAGLAYVERDYGTSSQEREFPGFSHAPSLEWAIHDEATRDRSLSSRLHRAADRLHRRSENRDGG